MSLTGIGKFYPIGKKGQIYLPANIVTDSQFPFEATTAVQIQILKNSLIISK